jgi:hypothetical protein
MTSVKRQAARAFVTAAYTAFTIGIFRLHQRPARYSTVEILLNDVPVMTAFFPIIHTIPVVR